MPIGQCKCEKKIINGYKPFLKLEEAKLKPWGVPNLINHSALCTYVYQNWLWGLQSKDTHFFLTIFRAWLKKLVICKRQHKMFF